MNGLEQVGDRIGPYQLLALLGEGGFGTVWLAERREPIVQRVALKVVKAGMDSREVIARFEQERQALAVMDHPNIARVFDAGTNAQGRPYFVMEHVPGEPIHAFCDQHRLTVRERLQLFLPVCEAVQHAHHKGILHRDLKPSNVLVTMVDGQPVPKVIDFGVAKAVAHTLTDKTIFTEQGQLIGTPEYMSPEQAGMGALDVDTRTDVYSLGVVLYELLTGALPFDPRELRSKGYLEIQRVIREVDPPTPSRRLTGLGHGSAQVIAAMRQVEQHQLTRLLRRELEWVPLKAMRKDRGQRYRTPLELADDIRAYLTGQPLQAGPESASYRLAKFLRRNRIAVATAAAFTALLLAFAVIAWIQAIANADLAASERAAKERAIEAGKQATAAAALAAQRALESEWQAYVAGIAAADGAVQSGDVAMAHRRLAAAAEKHRHFEWYFLQARSDRSAAAWGSGLLRPSCLAFSADGALLVGSPFRSVARFAVQNGSLLGKVLEQNSIGALVRGASACLAAGVEPTAVKVWNVDTGAVVASLPAHVLSSDPLVFGAGGTRLAFAGSLDSCDIVVHAVPAAGTPVVLRGMDSYVGALAFGPDARLLAAGSQEGHVDSAHRAVLRIFDATTGEQRRVLYGPPASSFTALCFEPAGRWLAAATADTLLVWDLDGEGPPRQASMSGVTRLCASPDGRLLLVAALDNTVRILDATSLREQGVLRGHHATVSALIFDDTGTVLATAARDGSIRLFETSRLHEAASFQPADGSGGQTPAALALGGARVAVVGDLNPQLFDRLSGERLMKMPGHIGAIVQMVSSPDGRVLASVSWDATIRLFDAVTGAPGAFLRGHSGSVTGAVFAADGSWLCSCGQDRTVRVWDLAGRCLGTHEHAEQLTHIAVSPDGRTIAAAGPTKVWFTDLAAPAARRQFDAPAAVTAMTYAPDGRLLLGLIQGDLLVVAADGTGEPLRRSAHTNALTALAVTTDGKRLASGGVDGRVRIWETAQWTDLLVIRAHASGVNSLQFDPAGEVLLSSGSEGIARIWDTVPERQRRQQRLLLAAAAPAATELVRSRRPPVDGWPRLAAELQADQTMTPAARHAALDALVRERWSELRRQGPAADKAVQAALDETFFIAPAVARITGDQTLEASVRDWALSFLGSHGDTPEELNDRAWRAVAKADTPPERLRVALQAATKASAERPADPSLLDTLGLAQYRNGQYQEAVRTLTQVVERVGPSGRVPESTTVTMAMARFQLGEVEPARAAIVKLRESLGTGRLQDEVMDLLREAERLVQPK